MNSTTTTTVTKRRENQETKTYRNRLLKISKKRQNICENMIDGRELMLIVETINLKLDRKKKKRDRPNTHTHTRTRTHSHCSQVDALI